MKIAVLGKGYLGKEFERQGYEVLGRDEFELPLFDNDTLTTKWDKLTKYDVLINCIAKSNTRWCEDHKNFKEARWINGEFVDILSRFCKRGNIKLVHVSTGCLYDCSNVPCRENDFKVTHCNYTVSKWIGENGCNLDRDLVIRPRLFFSGIKDKNNLLCKLPAFERYVNVLNSYTHVAEIPKAVQVLLDNKQVGIFNVANRGYMTVYEIAMLVGLKGERMTEEELCHAEELHLVNNIMDISKLEQFYKPPYISKAILECWEQLNVGEV